MLGTEYRGEQRKTPKTCVVLFARLNTSHCPIQPRLIGWTFENEEEIRLHPPALNKKWKEEYLSLESVTTTLYISRVHPRVYHENVESLEKSGKQLFVPFVMVFTASGGHSNSKP